MYKRQVLKDIPAYIMASGQSASAYGLNSEGLKRRGFSKEAMLQLKRAYKIIFRQGLTLKQAIEALEEIAVDSVEVNILLNSLKNSDRGILR